VEKKNYLFSSESVTEGHPDKIADQISDAILDAILIDDPYGRVACETLITTGLIFIAGEITTETYVDIAKIARETVKDVGYTRAKYGFDYETCGVSVAIHEQSPDISQGVSQSLDAHGRERRRHPRHPGRRRPGHDVRIRLQRDPGAHADADLAGTQAGASDERSAQGGDPPVPAPRRQVSGDVRYEDNKPVEIVRIVLASQHADGVDVETLIKPDMIEHVVEPILPKGLFNPKKLNELVVVNATGKFVIGGPMGDTGLTGRKIIVDTYGGSARHGGGAFSGKDPSKVDRSGAYAARYVAKNVVAAGLADRCELQVAYAIGIAHPISVMVDCQGTEKVALATIEKLIREHFDLRPAAILRDLDLRRPIYRKTAAYGHFGRNDHDFTWERTDKADLLREAAGLTAAKASR